MKKKFSGKQIASMIFGGGAWLAVSNAYHYSTKTMDWEAFYIAIIIAMIVTVILLVINKGELTNG